MKKQFSILFLLFYTIGFTQSVNTQKLDLFFKELETHHQFMGTVVLQKDRQIIYQKSIGFQNIQAKIKNNSVTLYNIGSISKTFTAVLVLKAIENNKLKLSETLNTFYPEIKNSNKITISDLLYHRSGIANFTDSKRFSTWNTKATSAEKLVKIITDLGSIFEPNTTTLYSNSNYVLLSFILEKVYNKTYATLLKEQITQPLNLPQTFLGMNYNTSSYTYKQQWNLSPKTHTSVTTGAGGIVSTPTDLTHFFSALFDEKLIHLENLKQMQTLNGKYGMGLMKMPFYNHLGYGHGGSIDGYRSLVSYFPDSKLSLAITSNGTQQSMNDIAIILLKEAFGKSYEIPSFSSSSKNVDDYLGVYTSSQLPLNITITKNSKNELIAQATGQNSFVLQTTLKTHTYKFPPAGIVIKFNPSKKTLKLLQGGGNYRFSKQEN